MIKTFKHKGLEVLYLEGSGAKVQQDLISKGLRILDRLEAGLVPEDMRLPGYGFHELKGNRKGTYSVTVNGNYRITFKYDGEGFYEIDLEDYH